MVRVTRIQDVERIAVMIQLGIRHNGEHLILYLRIRNLMRFRCTHMRMRICISMSMDVMTSKMDMRSSGFMLPTVRTRSIKPIL